MAKFKLDFIGIGVPRAATTWIAECLKEHPQICVSSPKEVHFWNTKKYNFGISWYKKHFNCKNGQIKGEYDPSYFMSEKASRRIKRYFPDIKIIVCLRNPIERAYSNYLSVIGFDKNKESFEEDIKRNPENLKRGLYYHYLRKYFKIFPKENILILIYEDIAKDPVKFIQKIYKFLNVDDNFVPQKATQEVNPSKVYRFPFIKRITGRIIKYIHNCYFGIYLMNFLRKIGAKKLFLLLEKINSKPIETPKMDLKTRKYLIKFYKKDIEKLEKLINRDLSFWR